MYSTASNGQMRMGEGEMCVVEVRGGGGFSRAYPFHSSAFCQSREQQSLGETEREKWRKMKWRDDFYIPLYFALKAASFVLLPSSVSSYVIFLLLRDLERPLIMALLLQIHLSLHRYNTHTQALSYSIPNPSPPPDQLAFLAWMTIAEKPLLFHVARDSSQDRR